MADQDRRRSDRLTLEELRPAGGGWAAALDDVYRPRRETPLSWSFTFQYAHVSRDYGDTSPHLSIDGVRLPRCSWTRMAGQTASSTTFGAPIEASVYFFEHFRYDAVDLEISDQRGGELRVIAQVGGDVDGLGIDRFELDEWLAFSSIQVTLRRRPRSVRRARRRLEEVTDVSGLSGTKTPYAYSFRASR